METLKKKTAMFALTAFAVCLICALLCIQTAYADSGNELVKSTITEKIVLQLGTDWAGVEFELAADAGKYPDAITVDDTGTLTLELGAGSTYILSCLNSNVALPLPGEGAQASGHVSAEETADAVDISAEKPESNTTEPAAEGEIDTNLGTEVIPTLHVVLFVGGFILCGGGLIAMRVIRRRRENYDDEDDE